jgi:hypothetical protein
MQMTKNARGCAHDRTLVAKGCLVEWYAGKVSFFHMQIAFYVSKGYPAVGKMEWNCHEFMRQLVKRGGKFFLSR